MAYFLGGIGAGILVMTGVWGWFIGRHKRKKVDNLTKYVIFSISFAIFYTVMEFIFSIITGVSHDVLSGCVYGFFCGELAITGVLKITKIKGENREDE